MTMPLVIMSGYILPPMMFLHLLSSDVLIKHKTLLKQFHKLLLAEMRQHLQWT